MVRDMRKHTVYGGHGAKLHVADWGRVDGPPILLLHGWGQSGMCWSKQYESNLAEEFRLVTPDLRGHGMSDKPEEASEYADGKLWADDVRAIIEALELDRLVLVAWSYASFVASDYLAEYGDAELSAINLVDTPPKLSPDEVGVRIGQAFGDVGPGMMSADLELVISSTRQFLDSCFAQPVSPEDRETYLAFNMVMPLWAKLHTQQRLVDTTPSLEAIRVPVLISHGRGDQLVLPAAAEYSHLHCIDAQLSWYDDCGHAPFAENPDRFNCELRALTLAQRDRDVAVG
jgi:non-heme chloroperoxidase